MIKRIVEVSQRPAYLSVKLDQLHIRGRADGDGDGQRTEAVIPCEDIGALVVDHPQVTYSHHALGKLAEQGAAVVICGRNHLPAAMVLPMSEHTEVVWRVRDQLAVSKPLRKGLWKQIVVAKVRAQAANLPPELPARRKLLALAREVRSGDPRNVEAHAARVYWSAWLGPESGFRRDTDGDGINALLNYGYAILRAAVARALVAAGLFPALGLHHANRSNAFCLADDLIEPLRPFVDARARRLHEEGMVTLKPPVKATLLAVLHQTVRTADQDGPLMVALHRMAASLAHCYAGRRKRLLIPTAVEGET